MAWLNQEGFVALVSGVILVSSMGYSGHRTIERNRARSRSERINTRGCEWRETRSVSGNVGVNNASTCGSPTADDQTIMRSASSYIPGEHANPIWGNGSSPFRDPARFNPLITFSE